MNLSLLKLIQNNASYTLCAAREAFLYVSHERGIAPIMKQIQDNPTYFHDCMIVDNVIGKAAAMLLCRSQVSYIHAHVMSEAAQRYLQQHALAYSFEQSCPYIINRTNTGMCPMEQCVRDIEDEEAAYLALKKTLLSLQQASFSS